MLTRIRKSQVKKIIMDKLYIDVIMLPSKANPRSPWFGLHPTRIESLEQLENHISNYKYYNCNAELGHGVAFWVDHMELEREVEFPKEKSFIGYKVYRDDGDLVCLSEEFAKHINTIGKRKVKKVIVYTPNNTFTEEELAQGKENNFFFCEDDKRFEGVRFFKA